MIFHVKKNSNESIIFNKSNIEFIMFLSKILTTAKTRYWSIELKIIDVIWIVKKVRHLIKSFRKSLTMIFTNHSAIAEIIKQTFLISFNTNKLNLRLIRASQYLFALLIDIKIKSDKFHIISNALSRFFSIMNIDQSSTDEKNVLKNLQYNLDAMLVQSINEIDTLFYNTKFTRIHEYLDIYFEQEECFIEMTNVYRQVLLDVYTTNTQWNKIREKLQTRKNTINIFNDMNFTLKNNFIYYESKNKSEKLCISWSMKKDVYKMTHNDNHHCEFHRTYARIAESLYIRHMIKRLRRYIHHCKQCLEEQTKRHSSYDELNLIKIMILFFHTIIIDFIVILLKSQEYDVMLTTTDKFFKRVNLVASKETWNAFKWTLTWLTALQKKEWKLSRAIISDKDFKFVKFFWKVIFHHFEIVLHFTTIYHSFVDDQSKRINQTIEIIIRFAFMKEHTTDFVKLISFIQRSLNNFFNAFIDLFLNELFYEFKVRESLNLLTHEDENSATSLKKKRNILKKKIEKTIVFANAIMKIRYDSIKTSLNLKMKNVVYLRLHKEYTQSELFNKKFFKQRLKFVKILEKIKKLAYKLKILTSWKIHSVISVANLESTSQKNDFYHREIKESESVENAQNVIKKYLRNRTSFNEKIY